MNEQPEKEYTSTWEVIRSTLAAFFGVQSYEQRKRDFTYGNPWHYIFSGFLMTVILVLLIYFAVKVTLMTAA